MIIKYNLTIMEIKFNTKFYLGINQITKERIYLSSPSWDCGWYWGFGYLGNRDCHYHINGLKKSKKYNHDKKVWEYEFFNLYDGLKNHFGNSLQVRESHLWKFAELFETFYSLKKTAEILGRGGSHLTSNPCKDIIVNKEEVNRINEIVLPAIFDEIHNILVENLNNKKLFDKIVKLSIDGDTRKIVDFMNKNNIHTDDLKSIDKLTKDDISVIHTVYWKLYHQK